MKFKCPHCGEKIKVRVEKPKTKKYCTDCRYHRSDYEPCAGCGNTGCCESWHACVNPRINRITNCGLKYDFSACEYFEEG